MTDDCLFCKISNGEIKSDLLYSDEEIVAFRDITPRAPEHILIIPRAHIATCNDIDKSQTELAGKLIFRAAEIAKELGVAKDGYRLVFNCNNNGGQEIQHLHLHLLAGRRMTWPPG